MSSVGMSVSSIAARLCGFARAAAPLTLVHLSRALQADAVEHALGLPDGAIERIGVARAIGDHAVEEALAVAPDAGMELRQALRVVPRELAVREIERFGDDVGQADRKRKHAWHQMEAEQAEGERHAAVARAVAGVD